MENIKEIKKELETLKNEGRLIVGVEQNRDEDGNITKNYILKNIWKEEKTNVLQLLGFLYSKTILQKRGLTIRYSYNYTDKQTISIIDTFENFDGTITKTKYTFYNVPTNCGWLDIYKLERLDGGNNENK